MKRTILAGALVVLLAFSANATAAPADKLKSFQARSAAETAAFDFYIRRKLDNAKVGRCKRQSRRRIVCDARASGETKRLLKSCDLRIRVRAVWRGYWDEAAAIVGRRCQKVPSLCSPTLPPSPRSKPRPTDSRESPPPSPTCSAGTT